MDSDFGDLRKLLPDDKTMQERTETWQSLFNKYSCGTDEDDIGISVYSSELDGEDCSEESEEVTDFEDDLEHIENRGDLDCNASEKYERLTCFFSPEVLENLKKVFTDKFHEYGINIPFWNCESKRISTRETLNENSLETSQFKFGSRNYQRCTDINLQRINFGSPSALPFQVTANEVSTMQVPERICELPPSIQKSIKLMMENSRSQNMNLTLRVREREYDLDFKMTSDPKVRAIEFNASGHPTFQTKPCTEQSSKNEDLAVNIKSYETKSFNITVDDIDVDDVSCGSSLSPVSSTDEEYFNKNKFECIRRIKRLKHLKLKRIFGKSYSKATKHDSSSSSDDYFETNGSK